MGLITGGSSSSVVGALAFRVNVRRSGRPRGPEDVLGLNVALCLVAGWAGPRFIARFAEAFSS